MCSKCMRNAYVLQCITPKSPPKYYMGSIIGHVTSNFLLRNNIVDYIYYCYMFHRFMIDYLPQDCSFILSGDQ